MLSYSRRMQRRTYDMSTVLRAASPLAWPCHHARQTISSRQQFGSLCESRISSDHHAVTILPRRSKLIPTLRAKVLRHRSTVELDAVERRRTRLGEPHRRTNESVRDAEDPTHLATGTRTTESWPPVHDRKRCLRLPTRRHVASTAG